MTRRLTLAAALALTLTYGLHAQVTSDRLLSAIAHGDADKDVAALALEQARASGLA